MKSKAPDSGAIDIELSKTLQDLQNNKTYLFDPNIDIQQILDFASDIKKNYNSLVVIGFGASCLNAKVLLSCLEEINFNIFFIDNVDEIEIKAILSKIEVAKTAIFAISLSGETDEVICLLKHIKPRPENLFISARSQSTLHNMANLLGACYLEYPAQYNVGRCALFSPVFLIIAGIAGVDIDILFKEGLRALKDAKIHAQALTTSSWILNNYNNKKSNIIIISYVTRLKGLLQWLEQMIAESLGKDGFGLMPHANWGSRYEHSMLQLFLDGPDDKMYKIFCNNLNSDNPSANNLDLLLKSHGGSVVRAIKKLNKPIKTYQIESVNETIIARYIIKYIITIDLLARRQQINPFNQPAVENLKLDIKATYPTKSSPLFQSN